MVWTCRPVSQPTIPWRKGASAVARCFEPLTVSTCGAMLRCLFVDRLLQMAQLMTSVLMSAMIGCSNGHWVVHLTTMASITTAITWCMPVWPPAAAWIIDLADMPPICFRTAELGENSYISCLTSNFKTVLLFIKTSKVLLQNILSKRFSNNRQSFEQYLLKEIVFIK